MTTTIAPLNWLTITDVAERLKLDRGIVKRWTVKNVLPSALDRNGLRRIDPKVLASFVPPARRGRGRPVIDVGDRIKVMDAAALLDRSPDVLWKAIQAGTLRASTTNGVLAIEPQDLNAYSAARAEKAAGFPSAALVTFAEAARLMGYAQQTQAHRLADAGRLTVVLDENENRRLIRKEVESLAKARAAKKKTR